MPLEALLALRFLTYAATEKSIASMIKICFFSIFVGIFSLTLVSAIMNGLEKETRKKLQGINADIFIDAGQRAINYEKVQKVLSSEYASSVAASSPLAFFHALLAPTTGNSSLSALILVKAIDPSTEPLVTTLHKALVPLSKVAGSAIPLQQTLADPWNSLSSSTVCIGQALAERFNLKKGDSATLFYPEEQNLHEHMNLLSYPITIGAVYKTGIQELDEQVVIVSFDLLKKLYSPVVSQIMLKLAPNVNKKQVIDSLRTRLSLTVYSWEELYGPLLAALTLEKYAMFFIVALISLVAGSTIIALLFMYATQKRMEIALLKSMGMANGALTRLFIIMAGIITMSATLCGVLAAAGAVFILQRYPFIRLPDAYYVTHLPAELSYGIIITVCLCACALALIAALIPARTVQSIALAHILKGLQS
ncbi:ABC transporter permease [Candidatus Dependentiae bacterium]|nr:ABC transporter permease [Candidatus Dependentiae bacterium]